MDLIYLADYLETWVDDEREELLAQEMDVKWLAVYNEDCGHLEGLLKLWETVREKCLIQDGDGKWWTWGGREQNLGKEDNWAVI